MAAATIDDILKQIRDLNNKALPTYTDLGVDEAKKQASTQYKSQYDTLFQNAKRGLDLDAERRGIFNSPLAADLMLQRNSQIQGAYDTDVAKLAADLVNQSFTKNQSLREADLNQRQSQLTGLQNLLAALQTERAYTDSQKRSSGGSKSKTSSNPLDEQRMTYDTASGSLSKVINSSYSSPAALNKAVSSWYQQTAKAGGYNMADYLWQRARAAIAKKTSNMSGRRY
jgi:hypothetical protein